MNAKRLSLLAVLLAGLGSAPLTVSTVALAADAAVVQPREGWYKSLVGFDFVRQNVDIPPRKGVMIVDSRPAARQFDPGHIPGAVNIPDTQFEKMVDKLPADKATLLIFYCGGVDCPKSHKSAFMAEALGYSNIKVYAEGFPDWTAKGGGVSVSAAYIKKLMDEKSAYTLIDARARRVSDKGMIPTAIAVSDTDFDKHVDKLPADKKSLVIYYCGGLECPLSDKSADKARKLGYTNVVTFPEGYPEWEKTFGAGPASAGAAEVKTGAAKPTAALVAGKEKGSVTPASFQQVWKENPGSILLVDVRDAKELLEGNIKGAVNIPMNDLEKKLSNLPKDKPVVFFCGTGSRAGEAYDTVKLLGADVQAWFIDAGVKIAPDGSFSIVERK
ncbi:MAG: rhodanese-like domain-containing protein [Rhodocyclaceae bacterium]|nr:rhodanese-like domain-containing protein [Rhodocyclaceae bacterium]